MDREARITQEAGRTLIFFLTEGKIQTNENKWTQAKQEEKSVTTKKKTNRCVKPLRTATNMDFRKCQ